MTYRLTLKSISPVTHDTNHLVFDRPEGFSFTPGQATDLALDQDGWREEQRPFTFVNLPDTDTLEFVIKSYPDHDGVTERIGRLSPGDTVLIEEPWGAIEDKGPGVFIAGGAGITPFVAILRDRMAENGTLEGSKLIFSNKTEDDIILRRTFERMDGLDTVFTVTDDPQAKVSKEKIDRAFLEKHIGDPNEGHYYVCGPDKMIEDVMAALMDIGVAESRIVVEDLD